jgi:hypothetical protein
MTLYRFQCSISSSSGIPADDITNTYYADCTSISFASQFADQLGIFYQTIDITMSSTLASLGSEIKIYDMTDPEPRIPAAIQSYGGLLSFGPTSLPRDVAVCLSFQGTKISGVSQASRRGRVYIGPLAQTFITSAGLVDPTRLATVRTAAIALLAASDASTDFEWVVYSPTLGTFTPVVDGWIDNEFDTQRSRGTIATLRNAWP